MFENFEISFTKFMNLKIKSRLMDFKHSCIKIVGDFALIS